MSRSSKPPTVFVSRGDSQILSTQPCGVRPHQPRQCGRQDDEQCGVARPDPPPGSGEPDQHDGKGGQREQPAVCGEPGGADGDEQRAASQRRLVVEAHHRQERDQERQRHEGLRPRPVRREQHGGRQRDQHGAATHAWPESVVSRRASRHSMMHERPPSTALTAERDVVDDNRVRREPVDRREERAEARTPRAAVEHVPTGGSPEEAGDRQLSRLIGSEVEDLPLMGDPPAHGGDGDASDKQQSRRYRRRRRLVLSVAIDCFDRVAADSSHSSGNLQLLERGDELTDRAIGQPGDGAMDVSDDPVTIDDEDAAPGNPIGPSVP